MHIHTLVEMITKKGRKEQLFDYLISIVPNLPKDIKEDVCEEMQELAYTMDLTEARAIVQKMTPYGEHWAADKVKVYIAGKDVDPDQCIHYYVVMNMMYNDYAHTAQAFGQKDNPDFYFQLAKDFIDDVDGVPFKVEKYFEM